MIELKKHPLSKYAKSSAQLDRRCGPTNLTESTECSDPDEFLMEGPTKETRTIEVSDADQIVLTGPTRSTFTIEASDEDSILYI